MIQVTSTQNNSVRKIVPLSTTVTANVIDEASENLIRVGGVRLQPLLPI